MQFVGAFAIKPVKFLSSATAQESLAHYTIQAIVFGHFLANGTV